MSFFTAKLDIIVMGTIAGAPLLPFCVLVTEAWNVGQDTNHHMASVDHVKMNSCCKLKVAQIGTVI